MTFSIITPSFGQLDWLRLCIASVADQAVSGAEIGDQRSEDGAQGAEGGAQGAEGGGLQIDDCSLLIPDNSAGQWQGAECGIESTANAGKVSEDEGRGSATCNQQLAISNSQSSPLCLEHIIQDAGSPGIEEFAKEIGAEFYRDGELIFGHRPSPTELQLYRLTIYSEADAGMYDAINRGLAKCRGEICAWINSDEQYLEGTLQKVAGYFSRIRELDVLLGDAVLTDGRHDPICYRKIMVPSRWHTRLDHLHALSCAMFFRKSSLPSPPLNPKWKVISDAILMDWFQSSKKRIVASGKLFSIYSFTGANLSANPNNKEHEQWLSQLGFPPRSFKLPMILFHRIRKILNRSYRKVQIELGIYTFDSNKNRARFSRELGGKWPKQKTQ